MAASITTQPSRALLIGAVLVFCACGASNSSGRTNAASQNQAAAGGGNQTSSLTLTSQRIGLKQTGGRFTLSRFKVESSQSETAREISGELDIPSGSVFDAFVNVKADGLLVYERIHQVSQRISIPLSLSLHQGAPVHFDIEAEPRSPILYGETIQLKGARLETDQSTIDLSQDCPIIQCNTHGFLPDHADIYPTLQGFTSPLSGRQLLYKEALFNLAGKDQDAYDYEVRFRSGRRGHWTNDQLKGRLDLVVDGTLHDSIPVHGHPVSMIYKLFFEPELFIKHGGFVVCEFYFTAENCSSDIVLLDLLTTGTDTGHFNYNRFGFEIPCR